MNNERLVPLSETTTRTRNRQTQLIEKTTGRVLYTAAAGGAEMRIDLYDIYRRLWRKANGLTRDAAWTPGDEILA